MKDIREIRTGIGFDVHRLEYGRKLVLGGITIPFEKGLLGHSDADVLIHALMDALLGAASMGDIGMHLPETDDRYRDISSIKLLRHVTGIIREKGYHICNADVIVMAQQPKIARFTKEIKENLAEAMGMEEGSINIKGTTTEKLGTIGKGEGIAAEAACLLVKYQSTDQTLR